MLYKYFYIKHSARVYIELRCYSNDNRLLQMLVYIELRCYSNDNRLLQMLVNIELRCYSNDNRLLQILAYIELRRYSNDNRLLQIFGLPRCVTNELSFLSVSIAVYFVMNRDCVLNGYH
jgi:hypothetical protein